MRAESSVRECAARPWASRRSTVRWRDSPRKAWKGRRCSKRQRLSELWLATAAKARAALEALGVGFGKTGTQPGRMYQYPGDPVARGVGTSLKYSVPA